MNSTMNGLPVLFLSHGSPMHGIEPGPAAEAWRAIAERLPRPRAILIASAHWETGQPQLTSSPAPQTIHDFYGFPAPLYALRYPAPGAPALAEHACKLLRAAGYGAELDPERGLDHGAWVPLLHAYPQADIAVVQVSIQPLLGTQHHYALGEQLRPLADEGVLIVGSGHVTHNLRDWRGNADNMPPAAYALEFQAWLYERMLERNDSAIIDYRRQAPHAARAHPSEEHFLPLHFALGAAHKTARAERVHQGMVGGALAMDAYLLA